MYENDVHLGMEISPKYDSAIMVGKKVLNKNVITAPGFQEHTIRMRNDTSLIRDGFNANAWHSSVNYMTNKLA